MGTFGASGNHLSRENQYMIRDPSKHLIEFQGREVPLIEKGFKLILVVIKLTLGKAGTTQLTALMTVDATINIKEPGRSPSKEFTLRKMLLYARKGAMSSGLQPQFTMSPWSPTISAQVKKSKRREKWGKTKALKVRCNPQEKVIFKCRMVVKISIRLQHQTAISNDSYRQIYKQIISIERQAVTTKWDPILSTTT